MALHPSSTNKIPRLLSSMINESDHTRVIVCFVLDLQTYSEGKSLLNRIHQFRFVFPIFNLI